MVSNSLKFDCFTVVQSRRWRSFINYFIHTLEEYDEGMSDTRLFLEAVLSQLFKQSYLARVIHDSVLAQLYLGCNISVMLFFNLLI